MYDQQSSAITMNLMNNETTTIIDKFIQVIAQQTISIAEATTQQYLQKAIDEKQKILNNRNKFKKPPSADTIITAIETRQKIMNQRMQYNTEQQLKQILANVYPSS
jgi:glycine cleavage system regulatory protein